MLALQPGTRSEPRIRCGRSRPSHWCTEARRFGVGRVPGKGTVEMDGSRWIPYQAATFPTPPFPDYVSGHSTYSAAAARILALWTSSDRFGNSVTLPAGSSKIEPGTTPAHSDCAQLADLYRCSRRGGYIPPLRRNPFSGRRPGWKTAGALRRHRSLAEGAELLRRYSHSANPAGDRERLSSLVHDRTKSLTFRPAVRENRNLIGAVSKSVHQDGPRNCPKAVSALF